MVNVNVWASTIPLLKHANLVKIISTSDLVIAETAHLIAANVQGLMETVSNVSINHL